MSAFYFPSKSYFLSLKRNPFVRNWNVYAFKSKYENRRKESRKLRLMQTNKQVEMFVFCFSQPHITSFCEFSYSKNKLKCRLRESHDVEIPNHMGERYDFTCDVCGKCCLCKPVTLSHLPLNNNHICGNKSASHLVGWRDRETFPNVMRATFLCLIFATLVRDILKFRPI